MQVYFTNMQVEEKLNLENTKLSTDVCITVGVHVG